MGSLRFPATPIRGIDFMKKLFGLSALVSPRVLLGVGLVTVTSLFGGTGCGLSYSLTGLYIQPATGLTCLTGGLSAQYHAYGVYSEGGHSNRIQDLSDQVSWSVTIPAMASVSTNGLVTAGNTVIGRTSILASTRGQFGNLTAASDLQVADAANPCK